MLIVDIEVMQPLVDAFTTAMGIEVLAEPVARGGHGLESLRGDCSADFRFAGPTRADVS